MQQPLRYTPHFYGVIDLLCVPTYLAVLLVPEAGLLLDVQVLRLLRVFRIFRLTAYMESSAPAQRAGGEPAQILVFLSFVLMVVLVMGTLMYVVEGPSRLHQHPSGDVLGGDHDDDGRLRRHHAAHQPRPPDRLHHDGAAETGRAGGAHQHRHPAR